MSTLFPLILNRRRPLTGTLLQDSSSRLLFHYFFHAPSLLSLYGWQKLFQCATRWKCYSCTRDGCTRVGDQKVRHFSFLTMCTTCLHLLWGKDGWVRICVSKWLSEHSASRMTTQLPVMKMSKWDFSFPRLLSHIREGLIRNLLSFAMMMTTLSLFAPLCGRECCYLIRVIYRSMHVFFPFRALSLQYLICRRIILFLLPPSTVQAFP